MTTIGFIGLGHMRGNMAARFLAAGYTVSGTSRTRERAQWLSDQVQAGTLTIMVGGDEGAYARVEPLLRVLGSPTRLGDNAQGLVLRLVVNKDIGLALATAREADIAAMFEVLERDGTTISPSRAGAP